MLDDDVPYNSSIGLFLTKRCPLRCAHCAVGSSPEDPDPADADVLRWAQALARSTRLGHVCVTGGEPFVKPDLLHHVATLFLAAGKRISVITSGFWATDDARADSALRRAFPPGTPFRLWLSLDPFHSAHLPARHYCAAINAAYALQIPVCVTATYVRDPQEAWRFIDATLDDAVARRRIAKIRAQPLFRVGRGAQLPRAASTSAALPRGVCGTCIGHVDAEGHVMACCSVFEAAADNPLRLGDLDRQPIDTLLEKGSRDWLIQAVRTLGPAQLAELAGAALPPAVFETAYLRHDICSVCSAVMRSPDAVARLRHRFARDRRLRAKVALLREVLYDEPDSFQQLT